MPIAVTSKKSLGALMRLTTSQSPIRSTKRSPSAPTRLGARRRLKGEETDASAATGGVTLLRSREKTYSHLADTMRALSRSGGTGRRAGLKIRFPSGSVGSTPTFGTTPVLQTERLSYVCDDAGST